VIVLSMSGEQHLAVNAGKFESKGTTVKDVLPSPFTLTRVMSSLEGFTRAQQVQANSELLVAA